MRHSVLARFLPTLVCTCCVLTLPSSALAAGASPVHIDPGSPVAKEYALPLATARGAPPESGKSGKLFGSGIKHASRAPVKTTRTVTPAASNPPASAPPATTPSAPVTRTFTSTTPAPKAQPLHHRPLHRRRLRHRRVHPRPVRPRRVDTTTAATRVLTATSPSAPTTGKATPTAYRVLRPGSGSGVLWMIVAAIVVIALGSAGGLALSRRR